jgi:hypothetical protein
MKKVTPIVSDVQVISSRCVMWQRSTPSLPSSHLVHQKACCGRTSAFETAGE